MESAITLSCDPVQQRPEDSGDDAFCLPVPSLQQAHDHATRLSNRRLSVGGRKSAMLLADVLRLVNPSTPLASAFRLSTPVRLSGERSTAECLKKKGKPNMITGSLHRHSHDFEIVNIANIWDGCEIPCRPIFHLLHRPLVARSVCPPLASLSPHRQGVLRIPTGCHPRCLLCIKTRLRASEFTRKLDSRRQRSGQVLSESGHRKLWPASDAGCGQHLTNSRPTIRM